MAHSANETQTYEDIPLLEIVARRIEELHSERREMLNSAWPCRFNGCTCLDAALTVREYLKKGNNK